MELQELRTENGQVVILIIHHGRLEGVEGVKGGSSALGVREEERGDEGGGNKTRQTARHEQTPGLHSMVERDDRA